MDCHLRPRRPAHCAAGPARQCLPLAYDAFGNRISATDPLGNTTRLRLRRPRQCHRHDQRPGQISSRTYHSFFNKPIAEVNPLGWTTHYDLDNATGNLLRQWDDLGTLASYTYTTNGLVADARPTPTAYEWSPTTPTASASPQPTPPASRRSSPPTSWAGTWA